MQIGNKKTALKDNAALYTHATDGLTEKEKMKSLTGRQKWIQFRDYYLLKIVAIIAVLVFIASLLFTVFGPKPDTVFYAAVCDYAAGLDEIEEMQKDFEAYIKIDPEKQETMFDSSFLFAADEYASTQKFAVYLAVGQISVAIMPESLFEKMAVNSYFKPMSEILPTDLYLKLNDRFVMSGTIDSDGNMISDSEKAYGLCLDGTRYFTNKLNSERTVLAVCVSWENVGICTDFIEFLLK